MTVVFGCCGHSTKRGRGREGEEGRERRREREMRGGREGRGGRRGKRRGEEREYGGGERGEERSQKEAVKEFAVVCLIKYSACESHKTTFEHGLSYSTVYSI